MPSPYYYNPQAAGANNGTSKTDAYQTYAAAVAAANANGDYILSSHTGQEELAADTTFTYTADITVVSINFSTDAVTAMGTGGWIGNSTSNRSVSFAGAKKVRHEGITVRTASGTADSI